MCALEGNARCTFAAVTDWGPFITDPAIAAVAVTWGAGTRRLVRQALTHFDGEGEWDLAHADRVGEDV